MPKPKRETAQESGSELPRIEEEIARRAYGLYLVRGGGAGRDVEDWLEAERLVKTESLDKETAGG
jgi:hypothetical protein